MTKLNLRELPEQIIYRFANLIQIICSVAKENHDYMRLVVLILENCMLSEIPVVLQVKVNILKNNNLS